jgi:hypothetical protein
MKTQTAILVIALFSLLLGGATMQSAAPVVAQTGGPGPAPWHTVRAGTAAGGDYSLTGLSWQASGTASGGGYRLLSLTGSGPFGNCCCTYLPLILRNK